MRLDAPSGGTPGRFGLERNQAVLPSRRRQRYLGADGVGVIAERLVEEGRFPDCSVDQISALRMVPRKEVSLGRLDQFGWRIGDRAEDGLAPDDQQILVVGDIGRRSDQVLELVSFDALCLLP